MIYNIKQSAIESTVFFWHEYECMSNPSINTKGVVSNIMARRVSFALVFAGFFLIVIFLLHKTDLLPNAREESALNGGASSTTPSNAEARYSSAPHNTPVQLPVRIANKRLGINATVANPTSADVKVLDRALLSGTARYPTSGRLGERGTVLIFGHSSYLPVIRNQAYKAFSGIQNLKEGEVVSVFSASQEFRYKVTSVSIQSSTDPRQNVIELPDDKQYLVLVTCDTFGAKTDRFVVEAVFDSVRSL